MDQSEFLAFVLGEPVKDYPVAVEQWADGKPQSALLSWEKLVEQPIEGANAFFLPRLESVQGITTIASDTDDREVQLRPSIAVETAEGRRNSYWRLLEPVTESQAETLLSFLDPHSPPSNYTRMFRLPGTFSSKHGEEQPFQCHVVDDSGAPCTVAQIMALEPPAAVVEPVDDGWLTDSGGPFAPNDWIAAVKFMADRNVARSVKIEIERPQANAAKMLYSLLRSGCTEKEAIWIVEASPCNPFRSWRYGVRTELAKLLVMARSHLRAVSVAAAVTRIRADRADKRKPFVIRGDASRTALADFKQQMTVLHASDGTKWAVEKRTGIAMPLVRGSSPIAHYINTRYGINPVDVDHHHVLEDMMAYAASRPPTAEATSISYYDRARNTMLVSFGGKEVGVLEAGSDRLTFQENGSGGIIFRPVVGADVLATRSLHVDRALQSPPGAWWNQIAPPETLQNLSRGNPEELSTLLHVWTIFVLFRNIAESRPILSCLGPMGCLSGDTPITIQRGKRNSRRTYSLADTYGMLHDEKRFNGRIWDPTISSLVMSLKGGRIKRREIKDVVCSGEKFTYTITIEGHEPFRATADHRFLTEGGWKRMEELRPGNLIVTGEREKAKRTFHHRKIVKARFHPGARQKVVSWTTADGEKKSRLYPSIYYAWAVVEAEMNGLSVGEFLTIVQEDEAKAGTLKYLPNPMVVHHKDENPENNDLGNLVAMTKMEHDALHHSQLSGSSPKVRSRPIVSIEPYGVETTYDIEMEDEEAPNFLVNGVVVHNSGKSTLSKKLHLLFYGRGVKLFQTTTIDDWNTVTSNYPLCLFDNVDAPTPWWLPPKLAISISPTDSVKRALFSNNDPYTRRCDAMIGVSSHDPSFLKEDVIDRMILAQFRRIDAADRLSESEMLNQVAGQREALVAGLLADALRTLSTPKPATIGSAIRIVDFAVIGGWIARAVGKEDAFRAAIGDLAARQHSRILEEDSVLVTALEQLQADGVSIGQWLTHSQLWSELLGISNDEGETIKRIYKGPLQLGRKLQAIATELRDAVGLEQRDDPIHGWPTFKVPPLQEPKP